MTKEELKEQINELMRQYSDEEIDGDTYKQKMMELTTSARGQIEEEQKRMQIIILCKTSLLQSDKIAIGGR